MKSRPAQLHLVQIDSPPNTAAPVDFDGIFLRYSPYAAAVAFRVMGTADEVDDIVQDVFIEVHKGLSQLKSVRHAKGWVATITVRICTKRLRKKRMQHLLVPGWATMTELGEYDIPQPGLSPEEQVWLKSVYDVLNTMAVPERVAWALRYLQGERLPQVARMCGCSLATAKRRIAKAHQMIRKVVDDE